MLLTYKGSVCKGEQCIEIYGMSQHKFANSKHILMIPAILQ